MPSYLRGWFKVRQNYQRRPNIFEYLAVLVKPAAWDNYTEDPTGIIYTLHNVDETGVGPRTPIPHGEIVHALLIDGKWQCCWIEPSFRPPLLPKAS